MAGSDDSRQDRDGARTVAARGGMAVSAEIDAFMRQVAAAPQRGPAPRASGRGRLSFAMAATASRRQPWDQAQRTQTELLPTPAALRGLALPPRHFRRTGQCRAPRRDS